MDSKQLKNEVILSSKKSYTKQEIRNKVFILAWPAIVEMFLATFTQIVDSAMVGRLGENAVAAVGLALSPMWLFTSVFMAVGVGSTALIARFVGANDHENASRGAHQSLLISLVLAVIVSSAIYALAQKIIVFMGAESAVIPLGTTYLRTLSVGIIFMALSFVLSGVLRGAGDTKSPMRVNILANLVNIVLNFFLIFETRVIVIFNTELLIYGMGLGVFGAAIGTLLARSLSGVLILLILFKRSDVVRLRLAGLFDIDWGLIKRIIRVGIPAAVERIIMSSGQIMFNRIVATLGTTAYAAHHLSIVAESISYMPGFGFAMAATTLVGQGLGAKDGDLADKCGRETWRLGAISMSLMGVLFFVFPHYFMRFLTNEQPVIALGVVCLRIVALAQPPFATALILSGALRGAGDTKFPMFSSMMGVWGIRLPLALLLGLYFNMGLVGIWLAMAIDLFFRGSITFLRFNAGQWQKIEV